MRFWDASALVPLIFREASTDRVRSWLEEDPVIVTWAWTRVEVVSAVERKTRLGEINRLERRQALERFQFFADTWDEVTDLVAVRAKASQLLARHSLRAADAGQLGAALLVAEEDPSSLVFVCLDERLALAAELEGLRVLP